MAQSLQTELTGRRISRRLGPSASAVGHAPSDSPLWIRFEQLNRIKTPFRERSPFARLRVGSRQGTGRRSSFDEKNISRLPSPFRNHEPSELDGREAHRLMEF